MSATDDRAALDAALKARNAAAKELATAESKLLDFAGEVPGQHNTNPSGAYHDALAAKYDAVDALDQLKGEIDQATSSYMGDRNRIGEHFLRHRDALPSELLAAANERVEAASAALVPIVNEKEKLEILYNSGKRNLSAATARLEDAAWSVLGSEVLHLATIAQSAVNEALRASAALKFVSQGVDLSAPEFAHAKKLLADFVNFYDPDKRAQQEAGAAPWLAAFNNLLVDANAPLPTDPKLSVAA